MSGRTQDQEQFSHALIELLLTEHPHALDGVEP